MFTTHNIMNVYVVTHKYMYSDHNDVSVFMNMDALMHKMEIIHLIGMDEGEEINIECMEVTDEETALERLNNVRKYKGKTND